ncbi:hypothetical protein ACLI1A_07145 [Flavobacterium sp. RHBU_3]|uniref:hypothetical protein n=1 Tax=Flavobacterium sp. RHBU_3 TaxID=3391184 RepID=UPI003984E617
MSTPDNPSRFNTVVLPVLKITLGSLLFFDGIYYILFIRNNPEWFSTTSHKVLPALYALPVIIFLVIWYKKRYRLSKSSNRRTYLGMHLLSMLLGYIIIALGFHISIPFLEKAFTGLKKVNTINEIPATGNTSSFYYINNYSVDTVNTVVQTWFTRKSRKNGSHYYILHADFCAPVKAKTDSRKSLICLYIKSYWKTLNQNNINPDFYLKIYESGCRKDFYATCTRDHIRYFEKIPSEWASPDILKAVKAKIPDNRKTTYIALKPHYNYFSNDFRYSFLILIAYLIFQSIMCWLLTLQIDPKE